MVITKEINKNMFREYDIRGKADDLNPDVSYTFGIYYGHYIKKLNQNKCIVGMDNRLSGPFIKYNLIKGILDAGIDVIDLGVVTTPMFYYARIFKNINAGIMITASHNPKDENGFKLSFNTSGNAKGKEIYDFMNYIFNTEVSTCNIGTLSYYNISSEYYNKIKENLSFGNKRIKAVIDPGNGVTSLYVKELFNEFPIDVTYINDKSDGTFPNHHPDPNVFENLKQLQEEVLKVGADVGIAFDGDGDRIGVISSSGNVIEPDKYAVIIIRDLFKKGEKKALYDIKCSSIVREEILKLGGIPYENRTGASYMMDAVVDKNVLFGIEYSGHVYFNNGFPPITSAFYASLKLFEIMSKSNFKIDDMLTSINKYVVTKEFKFPFDDNVKWKVIDKVYAYCKDKKYDILNIDGVKVRFDYGFALIRCSNTGPNITCRFEAKTDEEIEKLENEFFSLLLTIKNEYMC